MVACGLSLACLRKPWHELGKGPHMVGGAEFVVVSYICTAPGAEQWLSYAIYCDEAPSPWWMAGFKHATVRDSTYRNRLVTAVEECCERLQSPIHSIPTARGHGLLKAVPRAAGTADRWPTARPPPGGAHTALTS